MIVINGCPRSGTSLLDTLVVKKFNGRTVTSIEDIIEAQKANPNGKFDVVEFELDNPVVVIDREQLPKADMLIRQRYGINKLVNIKR